jgi:hypothetical protein
MIVKGVNVAATVGGVNVGASSIDGQVTGTESRPAKDHNTWYLTLHVPLTLAQYQLILAAGVPRE